MFVVPLKKWGYLLINYFAFFTGYAHIKFYFYKKVLRKKRFLLLAYHQVGRSSSGRGATKVSVRNFDKQIRFLKKRFCLASLDGLVDGIKGIRGGLKDELAITFDDGYEDFLNYAFPVLRKHDVPSTVFLVSGYVESGAEPWWDKVSRFLSNCEVNRTRSECQEQACPAFLQRDLELFSQLSRRARQGTVDSIVDKYKRLKEREMKSLLNYLKDYESQEPLTNSINRTLTVDQVSYIAEGGIVSFGSHTVTHPILTSLSISQAEKEIEGSKSSLEDIVKKPVQFFSYPNGTTDDFNDEIEELAARAGYRAAVTLVKGANYQGANVFALKRIYVGPYPFSIFKSELLRTW